MVGGTAATPSARIQSIDVRPRALPEEHGSGLRLYLPHVEAWEDQRLHFAESGPAYHHRQRRAVVRSHHVEDVTARHGLPQARWRVAEEQHFHVTPLGPRLGCRQGAEPEYVFA